MEHLLAEGRGHLRQTGRTGHDHLPGGHVRVDEHRAVLRQPPGHLALARPDASGKPDPQQLQYLLSRSPRVSGEDSGFGEEKGVYSAPDLPRNPDLPQSLRGHKNAASTRRGERGIRATLRNSGQLWPPDSFSRRAARASSEASVPPPPAPGVEVEVTA